MKKQYVSPKMDIVAIIHHRLLIGSETQGLTVQRSTNNQEEITEVGW